MKKTFHLTVRTPEGEVIKKEGNSIKVATEIGPMVVYPGHASLTGSIIFSKLWVRTEKEEDEFIVKNGLVFVSLEENSTRILCYSCQEIEDIDYATAKDYLAFVEEKLKTGASLNEFQLKFLKNEKIAMVRQMRDLRSVMERPRTP
jgi:F0F1-type ATP synthase epsilon subunit